MKFNLCNTFLVFLLSVIYFSCEAQRVVTSPGTCIRDADCAESSEFCDENFRCHLHLHENADCTTSHHCKKGLYCGWKDGRNACVPQLKPFQDCDIYANTPCVSTTKRTYKCYKDTHTCLHVGFIGDRCESTEDCQAGNYCDTANVRFTRDRKCAKQKPLGAPCSSQDECEDYCSYNSVPEINAGVCTLPSRIGKPCNDDTQCQGYNSAYNDPTMKGKSKVVCNIAKGYIGLCQHERDLIKKDGLTCNPNKDFCDSKRGLSCRTTPTGPRCMFNQLEGDYPNSPYCDINSKFSNCNPHIGRPTECRADDDQFAFPEAKHFFHCIYKREILPQGSLCNIVDDVVCEKGTTCMAVPGIEQERFPLSREAKFCVIVRQEGERCFSKFRFACAKRLKCKNNVCVKGTSDSTITHADLSRSCNSLPCVPGTECTLDFGRKTCNLKTVSKGEGEPCKTSLNSVNCGKFDEMTCSQNRNGLGLHLCRKKSDDAEPCIRDEDCMPPLKCNGSYPYRQCYNPKLTLSFGQSCNPDAKASKKRCIIADDGYSLGCLPKNKGYVCQKMADMYERCDVRKNVGCSPFSKTLCSNDGVCVPRA